MQKPAEFFKIALLLLAASAASAQPTSSDSVLTVDELLRIENAQVRDNAKKSAAASGLFAPNASTAPSAPSMKTGPKRPTAPSVTIHAIKGVGSQYRVDLSFNGELHKDVGLNARVKGRFELAKVQDACVSVTSLDKAYESAVACWTGYEPEPSEVAAFATDPTRGGPLPMPAAQGRPLLMPPIPGSIPSVPLPGAKVVKQ
jgi:hypothetical protein